MIEPDPDQESVLPLSARIAWFASQPHEVKYPAPLVELRELAAGDPGLAMLSADLTLPPVASVLSAICEGSPYLKGLVLRDPVRLQRLLAQPPRQQLAGLIAGLETAMAEAPAIGDAMRLLRIFKGDIALLTALADLGAVWPVMGVTAVLTAAADAAVQSAVRFLFRLACARGDWQPLDPARPERGSGYIVLGMGKYGAHELNYSSDIDLIVFYEAALTRVSGAIEPASFHVRLTRDLVRLLSERTSDGYVFRTDLRLRPDAGATQIALSADAALHYYETVGQNWERAALIKARAVAGDTEAGDALLAELAPFVWRKYLDFAAIADIHAMKRQIHIFRGFGAIGVPGHDIKLGPGGIREIEFFVQTQQLIAGGRQKKLRTPRTLDSLDALAVEGWITPAVAAELASAYRYLRTIEHRLQMVADEQTHELPVQSEDLGRFARFAGYDGLAAFSTALVTVLESVQSHYARLFETAPELTAGASNMVFAGESDDPATVVALAGMGFSQPAQVLATVRAWHHGRYRAMRSPKARERLTDVQPLLIESLAATADPDGALANFDRFLADLPSGLQLFALLKARPGLMQLVADIMGSAPRLARILSRRRRLFDAVLDLRAFGPVPTAREYRRMLQEAVPAQSDLEAMLDAARIFGGEQSFLIGVRVLAGTLTAADAGPAYADLAETLIQVLHERIERDLAAAHGIFPGCSAAILAMGKLGGREMTAASDLDLIVIYDVPPEAMTGALLSDGARPLTAPQYFARLTQRLVASLSVPTSEGTLYEVDLRLRPSGQKGPLATSLAGFTAYQTTEAWTWEHMALTRARVVSAAPGLRAKVELAVAAVLARPRDAGLIAADVRGMRERIFGDKGTSDPWDLKQIRGGLVDLEFIAQYLQLLHAARAPTVLDTNTRSALVKLASAGYLDESDAERLSDAARLLTNLTGLLRLMADGPFVPELAPAGLKRRLAHAAAEPGFSALEARLKETEAAVHAIFDRLVPQTATETTQPSR